MPRSLVPSAGLIAALALAACADETPAPDVPGSGALADSAATASDLVLGPAGLGRLGATTPFDTATVRAALPAGFTAELRSVKTAAGLVPVVWALRDGQLVLELYADAAGTHVGRIDAPGESVVGPGGAHTGQTFADVGGADMDCEVGMDELGGRAVCRGEGVSYVFASQSLVGRSALPPADSLQGALLERLVWRADG